MRLFLMLILLMLNSIVLLYAQEKKGLIKGLVLHQQQAVELANIALLHEKDSVFLAGAVSDSLGVFQFTGLADGPYLIRIMHLSFQQKMLRVQVAEGRPVVLPDVQLEGGQTQLNEVKATASKALFVKEKGKLIFNVENSVVGAMRSDLLDLISNLPGVWFDHQNNMMLNGQEKVRVTINDRPTYLTRGDLIQMLKAIPVNNVKSVEIISNPSAKQDAEGSSVINVKTKENVDAGFIGVLNTALGSSIGYGKFYPRTNAGLDLSLGKKNFSVFVNYNYAYKQSLGEITERLTFEDAVLNQAIRFESLPQRTHTLSSGLDVKLAENQSIALFYTKSNSRTRIDQSNFISLTDFSAPSSTVLSIADERPRTDQDAFNFSYENKIDSLNTIRLSADHLNLNKDQIAGYQNTYLMEGSSIAEKIQNNSATGIKVWAGQLDYTGKISKKSQLEAGAKYSRVRTRNEVDFRSERNGSSFTDSIRQSGFAYRENLAALYMNYKTELKKLSISAGLRYEQSKMSGVSDEALAEYKWDFSGFFPNFSLDHPLSSKVDLGFSYSRRIARPNYVDINPFIYYINPFVSMEGNPALVPSFTNKFELTAQLDKMYTLSLGYFHTKDVFTTAQFQDVVQKTQRLIPTNVGDLDNFELNLGIPFAPKDWWESYFNIGLSHQRYTEGKSVNLGYGRNSKTTFQLFSQHSFKLPKGFGLELDNTLITPSVQGQFIFATIYSFSGGIKKSFLDHNLELKISASDFLKTLKYDGTLQGPQWKSQYINGGDFRQLKFSARYNLYKKGKVNTKDAKWISNEEKKRMK